MPAISRPRRRQGRRADHADTFAYTAASTTLCTRCLPFHSSTLMRYASRTVSEAGRIAFMPCMALPQHLHLVAADPQIETLAPDMDDILDIHTEVPASQGAKMPILPGRITLDSFTLRYKPGAPPLLHGVSLELRAGEMIGIVSRSVSGSGRSTLRALFTNPRILIFDEATGALECRPRSD